jgi:hypothetical protein
MTIQDFIRNFLEVGLVVDSINLWDTSKMQNRLMFTTYILDYYQDTEHLNSNEMLSFDMDHKNHILNIYI